MTKTKNNSLDADMGDLRLKIIPNPYLESRTIVVSLDVFRDLGFAYQEFRDERNDTGRKKD